MFIHGGTSETGTILSDMFVLDLIKMRWTELNPTGFAIGGLTNHASCLVINREKLSYQNFNPFKPCDCGLKTEKVRHEGFYIFGGINESGQYINDLYIIKINRQIFDREKPDVDGKPPSPRADCSINFYEELKYVIIHGGSNSNEFFNDTFIFDIVKQNWLRIESILEEDLFSRCRVFRRAGHNSITYKDNLYIFGGNNEMFIGTELFSINLNLTKRIEFINKGSFKNYK
jgi:hypothetical protein